MTHLPEHLLDRYRRFKFRHFVPNQETYEELASGGQSPDVMLISCCDSRVDPETIFSAMPGELFVVRNVANLVPPYERSGKYHGVSAALEFAVLNLRVRHIMVMGHSGCGGIRAALDRDAARQSEAEFISNWMSMLDADRDRVIAEYGDRPQAEVRAMLEREAIKTSLTNLRTFPCVQTLEGRGRLSLHGSYFDIASGTLLVLNQATGELNAA
ncbi:MAG: carbonic anhydrase [Hyphomicrobiaceae bacterium]|jgi:carbonic anhydrase